MKKLIPLIFLTACATPPIEEYRCSEALVLNRDTQKIETVFACFSRDKDGCETVTAYDRNGNVHSLMEDWCPEDKQVLLP